MNVSLNECQVTWLAEMISISFLGGELSHSSSITDPAFKHFRDRQTALETVSRQLSNSNFLHLLSIKGPAQDGQ
jgi:hypothetical protein